MQTLAVVIEEPGRLALKTLELKTPDAGDVVVEVRWSGISTGTERLLWTGRMPPFPGLGYPLVPGYESVGVVIDAGAEARDRIGQSVFVPGSSGFVNARGLFGGAARRLVTAASRVATLPADLNERGALIALAATARHAIAGWAPPDLVVGHGALGRLVARVAIAMGHAAPTVWETNPARQDGAAGYRVIHPDDDPRRDYQAIYELSGDGSLLGPLIGRLRMGGEVVLAGFYDQPLSFEFPPAFMREARIRIAAQWLPADLVATVDLIAAGALGLEGLITHRANAADADSAYRTAFGDPSCLKMILDWGQGG